MPGAAISSSSRSTVATMRLARRMVSISRADLISTPRRLFWIRGPVWVATGAESWAAALVEAASRSAKRFIGVHASP